MRIAIALFAVPLLAAVVVAAPSSAQETRASAAAKYKVEFAASDTNHDGALTKAEVAARVGRMHVGKGKPDPVHTTRLTDLWFNRADADHNGKVTEAEGQALLASTFDRYDANHDGKVGGGERAAGPRPGR